MRKKRQDSGSQRKFDYSVDYSKLDLRRRSSLYRVGIGEQGVLLVEPYKSEILPHWRFATPSAAERSAAKILELFERYRDRKDFVGMDMARKFLQMGYTRSRRYANHRDGIKYGPDRKILPPLSDPVKAESARIFYRAWMKAETDPIYAKLKQEHQRRFG